MTWIVVGFFVGLPVAILFASGDKVVPATLFFDEAIANAMVKTK